MRRCCMDRPSESVACWDRRTAPCGCGILDAVQANADRRRHISKQKRKVTNWAAYDANLRQRGNLTGGDRGKTRYSSDGGRCLEESGD
jgi:hypothetical protein